MVRPSSQTVVDQSWTPSVRGSTMITGLTKDGMRTDWIIFNTSVRAILPTQMPTALSLLCATSSRKHPIVIDLRAVMPTGRSLSKTKKSLSVRTTSALRRRLSTPSSLMEVLRVRAQSPATSLIWHSLSSVIRYVYQRHSDCWITMDVVRSITIQTVRRARWLVSMSSRTLRMSLWHSLNHKTRVTIRTLVGSRSLAMVDRMRSMGPSSWPKTRWVSLHFHGRITPLLWLTTLTNCLRVITLTYTSTWLSRVLVVTAVGRVDRYSATVWWQRHIPSVTWYVQWTLLRPMTSLAMRTLVWTALRHLPSCVTLRAMWRSMRTVRRATSSIVSMAVRRPWNTLVLSACARVERSLHGPRRTTGSWLLRPSHASRASHYRLSLHQVRRVVRATQATSPMATQVLIGTPCILLR